jgi:hypothetical protein
VFQSEFRCHIGVISVAERKAPPSAEAEMLTRLRKLTEDVHRLRREFQAAIRPPKNHLGTASASDKSTLRKKRR